MDTRRSNLGMDGVTSANGPASAFKAPSFDTPTTTGTHHLPPASATSSSSLSNLPVKLGTSLSFVPHDYLLSGSIPESLTPLRIASLRANLGRRRSSFPPATIDQITSAIAATSGDQLTPQAQLSLVSELGLPELSPMWTPVGWDTLLNFEGESTDAGCISVLPRVTSASLEGKGRIRSEAGDAASPIAASEIGGSKQGMEMAGPASLDMARGSPLGGDRAWKTILASQVEVEGVGQIGVARVLQEVWRRGGGEQVTTQGLWPSIIISLSLPEVESPGFRLPTPSAHAALALQNLYNITLRHWEPSIFTGLLSSFGSQVLHGEIDLPSMLGAAAHAPLLPAAKDGGEHIFGVATPQKEVDMSQWTNLTPGTGADWSFLNTSEPASAFAAPTHRAPAAHSNLAHEIWEPRRGSTARSIEDDGIRGLDEILAQMEEGLEAREVAAMQEQMEAASRVPDLMPSSSRLGRKRPAEEPFFQQMPTPETDASDTTILSSRGQSSGSSTDRKRQLSFNLVTPPSSHSSPLATSHLLAPRPPGGQSALARPGRSAQLPTPSSSTMSLPQVANGKKKAEMQLAMPIATFVPPPPMCMFFSPVFHDLQKDKVGVWKGDLEVRGKGGGRFSVLIVGEASTGHLWQSHVWPTSIVYPPEAQGNEDATATATMIPVSHLAREGFTPSAMGMVLCNDANIEAYVNMVQGLHAEGVAFHLSTPNRLPIVFLPAKFDSSDPLQRLGVAFMTKPGIPYPSSAPMAAKSHSACPTSSSPAQPALAVVKALADVDGPKKKKRRQSAPAGILPSPRSTLGKHKKRESVASAGGRGGTIPEETGEEKR